MEEIKNLPLDLAKARACSYVAQERKDKLSKGFPYGDYHIKADDEAINRMLGYKDAARDNLLTLPAPWWTYEEVEISISDQQELINIGGMMMQFVQVTHTEESATSDQIKNATTIEEIEAIYTNYVGE